MLNWLSVHNDSPHAKAFWVKRNEKEKENVEWRINSIDHQRIVVYIY